jgi:hypothetical protein
MDIKKIIIVTESLVKHYSLKPCQILKIEKERILKPCV